ncbi:restriction endonuclease subunit S [Streptomyces celluloflavus]|uniref:Restriction endonuclease subunit S n=1 Tax=Streptomyces celluloflavus TaxID=58344 RepID=A0ABW7R7C0_9ACTN
MIYWQEVQLHDAARTDAPIGYGIVQPGPYVRNGIPVVAIRDLPTPSLQNIHRSAPSVEASYRRSRVTGNDVLISVKGTTGRVGIVPVGFMGNISRDVARLRLRDEHEPAYWFQMLQSPQAQRTLQQAAVGSTRQELSIGTLKTLSFCCPSRQGQERISAVLSDADQLIEALKQLIVKKQAIKQGMMQDLLTAKTRLPGFNASWRTLEAGDIGTFKGGSGFPIRYQGSVSGRFPFFKVSDMNNSGNELFMSKANNYISDGQRKRMGAVVMPRGAIVFAKVGAAVFLERKRILAQSSCIDNNMAAFILDNSSADVRFVHHVLTNFPLGSLVATGALPSLNGRQLRSIPLTIPADLNEQRAIAAALDDVDNEIGILRQRLTKARDVKHGMMQQLLTGRTRLPVEEGAA